MVKKYQRVWLILLLAQCLGIILLGGVNYVSTLRNNLTEQAIQNVITVTRQQQQAFDNFIAEDRELVHGIADFFAHDDHPDSENIRRMLTMFSETDTVYSVICLDDQWFCGNTSEKALSLTDEQVDVYRTLEGSGVRDTFVGIFSGIPRFSFYESFTFSNGHKGLVQKSYDRSKVSETFSLSFYNDRGLAFVVNQRGDILLRSVGMLGDQLYENIFEILTGTQSQQTDIDRFEEALTAREAGSLTFAGDTGSYVYTYVPIETVDNWFLVSIVPEDAISEETDEIILDSQQALGFLVVILLVCAIFILLIRRTHKELKERDNEIAYQTELINIFSTYLSRNTDNVFMLFDVESFKLDYISPNVERVLGIPNDMIMADTRCFQPVHMREESGDHLELLCALEPGMEEEDLYLQWINPQTQEQLWLLESAYCTQLQDRKKLVFYISDRTRDRKTQDSLSEALQMAKAASEAKSAFLGNVSHDIRTPMNAIIGFLTLLQDEVDDPAAVREYAQRIDAASQHLLSLINDVLDINKIESGSATLNLSELSLAEIVDGLNTIIRPQAKTKDQNFEIFVSPLNYEHLIGDKLRINQILINLLSNSVKYTPEGGKIQLRVEELPQVVSDYSRIRFTVSDNGLGMSEEYLKVIFDPFTREETSKTKLIQGTGLGMAITKSLVDLMGGSIQVESKLNEGSTFTVELELRIQEMEDDPKFWANHKIARMIVADDDEEVCHAIVKTMSKGGVAVDYATDGDGAIRMMRENREAGRPYDLILLDWKMPNLNGLDTARHIRKNYPDKIPILLLTAYDWSEIEQEAMEIGINHFMPKPFFVSTFKDAIRRVMGSQKKQAQEEDNVVAGRHILVVDDIEVNRIILVKILNTLGASCDTAGNGQEALEKFETSPPGQFDLILMDVQMPVMDGYSATRAIRALAHPAAKEIPIIAMTANAFVDDVREAIESGMDAHVAKPVQVDTLKTTIRQVLDSRSQNEIDQEGSAVSWH